MLVRPSTLGLVALALLGTLLAMLALPVAGPDAAERNRAAQAPAPEAPAPLTPAATPIELKAVEEIKAEEPERPAKPRGYRIARVKTGHTVKLRSRPGGPTVARVGDRTEFGSKRVLAVAAVRGSWLGVTAVERPNGKLAWIKRDTGAIKLSRTKVALRADLSRKTIEVRVGRKTVAKLNVAIGRPGSPTPTGRFQVTDKLSGGDYGPYYGCCILALSGKQPNTPAGWKGGNRLAIHGTNAPGTIGMAASAGCLRGSDRDLKLLMRRVPVGTPVFIGR